MATALKKVIDYLDALGLLGLTDKELLARFVTSRDEAAFATLVRRHGGMVLDVCRRLLRNEQDVEDAFQASFFVLARKAGSTRWRDTIAPWLHEVANRTAREVRAVAARRRAREKQVDALPHPEAPATGPANWRPVLDEELGRLPEKYRAAVVLCELEGTSRREAACQLGVCEGTLSSRLATARRMLAKRLARRGVALPVGALLVASPEVSAALVCSTTKVATLVAVGQLVVATPAAVLARGVMKAMLMTKLKLAVGAMVAVAALGTGSLAYRAEPAPAKAKAPQTELEELRKENELLRLNLKVVLEKVRALEAENGKLRSMAKAKGKEAERLRAEAERQLYASQLARAQAALGRAAKLKAKEKPDLLEDIEAALKALRSARDPAAKRDAANALEKAMKRLKEEWKKMPGAKAEPK